MIKAEILKLKKKAQKNVRNEIKNTCSTNYEFYEGRLSAITEVLDIIIKIEGDKS